jgi:carbamoyl-phosphate synthase large subunit
MKKGDECIIGVSGINAVDNPGPCVGIARALKVDKELNARIVGLAYDAMEPGIYLDWLMDKCFVIPYPSSQKEALLQRLNYIKCTYGLDFIFPNLDSELPFYCQCRDEIEAMGIKLFVPNRHQLQLRGKDKLGDLAKHIGIDIPNTLVVNSYDRLMNGVKELGLPVMVKGSIYKTITPLGNRLWLRSPVLWSKPWITYRTIPSVNRTR